MKKTIAVVGTQDTKGPEIHFVCQIIRQRGHQAFLIDIGVLGEAKIPAAITREEVALAGGTLLAELIEKEDELEAGRVMARGLKTLVLKLVEQGRIQGLLSMGGGQGSSNVAPTLKSLPLGFPKILISTKVTQAGAAPFAGNRDVVLVPSVADLAGLNRLTRRILANAAGAVIGMVETELEEAPPGPLVVMSMNGTVTGSALLVKEDLENEGYEVLVYHTIGTGGRALEDYVSENPVTAVIEFAVNELSNELFGGMASAGPNRLEAAGRRGIPQIIIPGSADFINFLTPATVPERLADRPIHQHNPQATIVRTSPAENRRLGQVLAEKLNQALGKVILLWPEQGLSSIDRAGKVFFDPRADQVLFQTLTEKLKKDIPVIVVDEDINSPAFAGQVVETFRAMMAAL